MTGLINSRSLIVVPYIGTWIETEICYITYSRFLVVPYIGTWIETCSLTAQ